MTDYHTSNPRKEVNYSQDTDSTLSNIRLVKKVAANCFEKSKRLMPSRENANRSKKDLTLSSTRKFKGSDSEDSQANFIPFKGKTSVKKLSLKDVQKYARAEGPSTGRRSNKSGKDNFNPNDSTKVRDLRSIFYKKNGQKTTSEKLSARHKSSKKMISNASTQSLKSSRRSSNKRSTKCLKKAISPKREDSKHSTFIERDKKKILSVTNPFSKSKSLLRGNKSRK